LSRIELERRKISLTQEQLAQAVGVRKQTVCEWERHDRVPKLATLRKLAKLFGTTLDYLLEQAEEPRDRP